jgi:hypothetical protein
VDHLPEDFCWRYGYEEEGRASNASPLGPIYRPVVPIQFVGPNGPSAAVHLALVDSGANSIMTPEWVAMELGIELDDDRSTSVGLGGKPRRVRYAAATLRLLPPSNLDDEEPVEWETDVGFMDWGDPPWMVILGQRGFFDTFTVTMSQFSQQLAVHRVQHFDDLYGPQYRLDDGLPPGRAL